jgi:hypothetical protein
VFIVHCKTLDRRDRIETVWSADRPSPLHRASIIFLYKLYKKLALIARRKLAEFLLASSIVLCLAHK